MGAAPLLLLAALVAPPPGAAASPPRLCDLPAIARAPLSGASLSALELLCEGELEGLEAREPAPEGSPTTRFSGVPANIRVNDPSLDPTFQNGTHITQSEVSVAFSGSSAVMAYNDTTHLSDAGTLSLTGFAHSPDGGVTWQDRGEMPSAGGNSLLVGDPVLASRPDGTVVAANLFWTGTQATDRHLVGLSTSTDGGMTFGPPSQTWPTSPPSEIADKPWLAVDDTASSPRAGRIYVAWANFNNVGDSVILLTSSADGVTWLPPSVVSDPTCAPMSGAPHSLQGIQVDVAANGDVHAAWWCVGDTAFQIRTDVSTDGGVTWGTDRIVTSFLDPSGAAIVDCGVPGTPRLTIVYQGNIRFNDFPSLAINPQNGTLHVLWTQDPDGFGTGIDDAAVYHSRSTDNGASWSQPAILGSHPSDQFFPMIRVAADGTVAAAWYDRRNDPSNVLIDMYAVSSLDDGASFGSLERITTTSFGIPKILPNYDTTVRNCYMGDYNGMAATSSNGFLVGWGDNRDSGPAANNGLDQNIYAATYVPPKPPPIHVDTLCAITGTPGRDILRGTAGNDLICGLGGRDTLSGKGGKDILKGGGGADVLRGGPDKDRLLGGPGRDRCPGRGDVKRSCER